MAKRVVLLKILKVRKPIEKSLLLCKGGRKKKKELEKTISDFLKQLWQLFFAMVRLAALRMCKDIGIEILPMPHRTFNCFSKNGHKSTQTRCKVCSNLTSVLQQLTFALLEYFLLTLNTFHTYSSVTIQTLKR